MSQKNSASSSKHTQHDHMSFEVHRREEFDHKPGGFREGQSPSIGSKRGLLAKLCNITRDPILLHKKLMDNFKFGLLVKYEITAESAPMKKIYIR